MNGNFDNKFWYYENGKLTPTEINLPEVDDDYNYHFAEDGIRCYSQITEKKSKFFPWNGKEFVKAE